LRTLPFVGLYGVNALRDAVVIVYGGFSLIIIALLLEDARRINTIVRYYNSFLNIYIPTIPVALAVSLYLSDHVPRWSTYNVPVLQVQPGEVAAHLAGAAVFALVGFRKAPLLSVVPVLATFAMVVTASRGAMLAAVVPVMFAALVLGKARAVAGVLVIG